MCCILRQLNNIKTTSQGAVWDSPAHDHKCPLQFSMILFCHRVCCNREEQNLLHVKVVYRHIVVFPFHQSQITVIYREIKNDLSLKVKRHS